MPQITILYNVATGAFQFNPDPLDLPYNASSTITWKVQQTGPPVSGTTVQFPATGGIVFGSAWPGTPPVIDPNDSSKYSATDNNDSSSTVGDFKYTTTLAVTSGGQTTNPSYDPEIENEGPPAMVSRKK